MSVWQQILFFALKGLNPSYYWRHFVLGGILPILFIAINIYMLFKDPNTTLNDPNTAWYDVLITLFSILSLMVPYPFSRFAYECIIEFIMGNNVIIANGLIFFFIPRILRNLF